MGLVSTAFKKIPGKALGYLWDRKLKIFVYSLLTSALTMGVGLYAKDIYQVRSGEGYILTERSGKRIPMTMEGWYFRVPVVTGLEGPIKLFKQQVYLDGKEEPHPIIAKSDYVLNASAVTFMQVTDLYKYSVLNVDSKRMLQNKLDSIIGYQLRQTEPVDLLHKSDAVAKTIDGLLKSSSVEKDFGIKIDSFNILKATLIDKVIEANAEKQKIVAEEEGRLAATEKKVEGINKLTQAEVNRYNELKRVVNPQTSEEKEALLNYINNLIKWDTIVKRPGDTTWIITEGENKPNLGIIPNSNKKTDHTDKKIRDLESIIRPYGPNN